MVEINENGRKGWFFEQNKTPDLPGFVVNMILENKSY